MVIKHPYHQRIDSLHEKMLADLPRLKLFNGVTNLYLNNQYAMDVVLWLGLEAWIKAYEQIDEHEPIIVVANDLDRAVTFEYLLNFFPLVAERGCIITLKQLKGLTLPKRNIPIVWTDSAIVHFIQVGNLQLTNLRLLERLIKESPVIMSGNKEK